MVRSSGTTPTAAACRPDSGAILRGLLVEIVVAHEALNRCRRRQVTERSYQLADVPPELQGTAGRVRLPKRHLAGLPWCGRHDHTIVRDLFDPPARRAEQECFPDAALEHHLFVQLADACARPSLADEKYAVQPAIRNSAAVDDGDPLRSFTRDQPVLQSIPCEAGTKIREVVRRVPARQHVEDTFEDGSAEIGEWRRAPDGVEQAVTSLHGRDHGDDLWRALERVTRIAARFNPHLVHGACHRRARDQIASEFRHDDAAAGSADRVPCAADTLHPAGNRRRGLDLDDEIDRPHVDAELERRRGDKPANRAGLQSIFDLDALRTRERSVMRSDERSRRDR